MVLNPLFFLLNFQGYGPFFKQFSEIKKSNFFRKKYPKTMTTNFVKAGSKKIDSFMMIFTVYRSRMADTTVFFPKKFKDIPWHGIFFLCDIHFFLPEKVSVSKMLKSTLKKLLLKSRTSLSHLTSGPNYGIKHCFRYLRTCYHKFSEYYYYFPHYQFYPEHLIVAY